MRTHKARGLPLAEDPVFQRRAWIAQRVGWGAMAAVVAAALAGAFGDGPASRRVLLDDGARVVFDRTIRQRSPTTVEIRVPPGLRGEVAVALDSRYVAAMRLQRVVPFPSRVESGGGTTTFVFAARDGSLDAIFDFKPAAAGELESEASVAGRSIGRIAQRVLP